MRIALLFALLGALSASAANPGPTGAAEEPGIHLNEASTSTRSVSLLQGESLDGTFRLSESPPLRLTDGLRFDRNGLPVPLDHGGAVDGSTRQVLALLLGLLVGFGLGHFVARDRNGFILFLVVDIAIIVVASVLQFAIFHGFWFGYLGLLISHVIQGIDAYGQAGGERILERTRQSALRIAATGPAPGGDEPAITTRVLSWAF